MRYCKPVSRILFLNSPLYRACRSAIIYLGRPLPAASICLPRTIGRAALKRSCTRHFSTQGLPGTVVSSRTRGLLPHVFTLAAFVRTHKRRSFSVALSRHACGAGPAVSGMRCSALSGLSYPRCAGINSTACSTAKLIYLFLKRC